MERFHATNTGKQAPQRKMIPGISPGRSYTLLSLPARGVYNIRNCPEFRLNQL